MAGQPYFAPSYFSSYYFGSLATETPAIDLPSTNPVFTDFDGFCEIKRLLDETGAFASVRICRPSDPTDFAVGPAPQVVISPTTGSDSDDADPDRVLRTVDFDLVVTVSGTDPISRICELDRLAKLVARTLRHIRLSESCVPAASKISSSHFNDKCRHPNQQIVLKGQFAYFVL